ncbi:MAG: DUF447 family protein [Syntrophaceae bacterium]|nr:DUF447 family protein [Syntrophaceae bacterium]
MSTLKELGMKKDWLYEVVLSSFDKNTPHAAPFGVKTTDFNLVTIEMYKGSNTLKNILTYKEFVLNTIDDPVIFYQALYDREKINFGLAKMINAPVLTDSPASIEVRLVNSIDLGQCFMIDAAVVYVHIRHRSELINRAKGLVFESLIMATRMPHLAERKPEELLRENYRIIKKVAPGSKYEWVMQELLNKCGR